MNNNPFITIITPTYNRAHLLSRTINSVLAQTFGNWEYIIVDDASRDNTEEVVNSFKDERIKYIKYNQNGGNAVARNKGVNAARGKYISFVDSDDEYHPTYLEKAISKIKSEPKASFLWAGTRTIGKDGSAKDSIWIPKSPNKPSQFLFELHVGIGRGFLIKKECFSQLRFDENLRTAVDTDFLIRLRQKFDFTVLQEVLLIIHTQEGSVRANYSEKKKSYRTIIEKHSSFIQADDFLRYKWYYKLFWLSLYDGDRKLARKAYSQIVWESWKPSFLFFLFSVFKKDKAIKIHRKLA